jgi:hypothetical protein
MWGDRDRTVPFRHADAVRETRPDAEIVVLERAGHVAMVERPDAFVAALDGLLQRLPQTRNNSQPGALYGLLNRVSFEARSGRWR